MIIDHLERTYEELKNSQYPVFIWGAGSMSMEVSSRLKEQGIAVCGKFITTAADRSHIIPSGERLFTLEELQKTYEKINVVAGHGHYEKIDGLKSCSCIHKVYVIPNPYLQYKSPDLEYIYRNQDKLAYVFSQLADEQSQTALERYLAVGLTNDIRYLMDADICTDGMYGLEALHISDAEDFVDVGAWEGDSISAFLRLTGGKYHKIHAFEPDPASFQTLQGHYGNRENICLYRLGLGETDAELTISRGNTQSACLTASSAESEAEKIIITTLDEALADEPVSLIKVGIPFMFADVIKGGAALIRRYRPRMIIGAGFDDRFSLYDIVTFIIRLEPSYRLVLRFDFPMPTRLFLYAYPAANTCSLSENTPPRHFHH